MDTRPIGVFDSGIGGLTVVSEIFSQLPGERVIYLGDTARFPYGPKSSSTVTAFAKDDCRFLLDSGVKLIVAACNTATAYALPSLCDEFDVPVIGVIHPGATAAARASTNGLIGVIGTEGTIASDEYQKTITEIDSKLSVFAKPCPLFVALAEEGATETDAAFLIAADYLEPIRQANIDTLVLGCTHYPLLKNVIRRVVGPQITLVDSAEETARTVADLLRTRDIAANGEPTHAHGFFVTDLPTKFAELGERFLGYPLPNIEMVEVGPIASTE